VTVATSICIAVVIWVAVIPSAIVALRLHCAAASERRRVQRRAPAPLAPRRCERRHRRIGGGSVVTRPH
jgi:hypothetical protein